MDTLPHRSYNTKKMVTRRNKVILLELRRERVQQLVSRGYSQRDISKKIGVSLGLVNNDIKFIRKKTRENIKQATASLTEEMQTSLVSLKDVIQKAWQDVDNPEEMVPAFSNQVKEDF